MVTILNENYLDTTEVADLLGISVMTVRRWAKDGKLTKVKLTYKKVYYAKSQIEGLFIK